MEPIFLSSPELALGFYMVILSPIAFITGLIIIASSRDYRKLGIKIVIGSVIAFIIGFGTCFANLSLGGMHW